MNKESSIGIPKIPKYEKEIRVLVFISVNKI